MTCTTTYNLYKCLFYYSLKYENLVFFLYRVKTFSKKITNELCSESIPLCVAHYSLVIFTSTSFKYNYFKFNFIYFYLSHGRAYCQGDINSNVVPLFCYLFLLEKIIDDIPTSTGIVSDFYQLKNSSLDIRAFHGTVTRDIASELNFPRLLLIQDL